MDSKIKNKKSSTLFWIAFFTILILGVFSVVSYKERMLFLDTPWVVFKIINTHTFLITDRWGAFITQLFPLVGFHLGLSVKTILILYSASFYIFYLAVAWITGRVFKQEWLSILLALYLTLFVSDGYYWPINEVHQGIAWMLLFIGLNQHLQQHKIENFGSYFLSLILAALGISCHLLVIVPFAFFWMFIHRQFQLSTLLKKRSFIITSIFLIAFVIIKIAMSNANGYDTEKLSGINNLQIKALINVFFSGQFKSFLQLCFKNYWLIFPIGLGSICFLLKSKQYLWLAFLCFFSYSYVTVVCITYPDAFNRSLRFYMESEWTAWSIIIAAPFVVGLLTTDYRKISALILFLIFSVRLAYIFSSYPYFQTRLNNLETTLTSLQNQNIHKALIIQDDATTKKRFIMSWGLPVESILWSKMKGDKIQTTFKVINNKDTGRAKDRVLFYAPFRITTTHVLNPKYFALDSTQYYQVIDHSNH